MKEQIGCVTSFDTGQAVEEEYNHRTVVLKLLSSMCAYHAVHATEEDAALDSTGILRTVCFLDELASHLSNASWLTRNG